MRLMKSTGITTTSSRKPAIEAEISNGREFTIWALPKRPPNARPSTTGSAFLNPLRNWRGGLGAPIDSLGSPVGDWPVRLLRRFRPFA